MAAEPAPGGGALPVEVSGRLLGAYAWVERRLFEVVGTFARAESQPSAAAFFDAHSRRHAWHAELFAERLPLLPGFDHDTVVAPPGPEADAALGALAALPHATVRLAGLAELILPRLVAGYRRHLELAAPVADAPVMRALQLVVADEEDSRDRAAALLVRLTRAGARPTGPDDAGLRAVAGALPGDPAAGLAPWPGPTARAGPAVPGGPAGRA